MHQDISVVQVVMLGKKQDRILGLLSLVIPRRESMPQQDAPDTSWRVLHRSLSTVSLVRTEIGAFPELRSAHLGGEVEWSSRPVHKLSRGGVRERRAAVLTVFVESGLPARGAQWRRRNRRGNQG